MQFGEFRVEVVPDCEFRLDGGAMFGVVPRALWSRVSVPDDQNRIALNMNCLFVEAGRERILIDTGIGEKWSPKHESMYGINRKRPLAESLLAITGVEAADITIVVNSHLHFDHAGGNTSLNGVAANAVPTFPNARYFVSSGEHAHAEQPNERDRASYVPEDWRPLEQSGQLELKEANYDVVPGLKMEAIAGHSRTMQCARLESGGKTLFGFADLVPTRAHVPLAWVMSYDLFPTETVEAKKRLLPQAAREGWVCHFYHDPEQPLSRMVEEDGKLRAVGIGDKEKIH